MNPTKPLRKDAGFITLLFLAVLLGASSLLVGFVVTADLVQTRLRAAQSADAIALALWQSAEVTRDPCAETAARLLANNQQLVICKLGDTSYVQIEAKPRLAITAKLFPLIQVAARAGLELGDQVVEQ
jgi:hypothetical protein